MAIHVVYRAILFSIFVPGMVGGLLPYLIGKSQVGIIHFGSGPLDIIGYILFAIGAAMYLWCAYDFAFIGRGTGAVFDPPTRLVVRGLYKYTRNPMYVGVLSAIIGQAIVYGATWLIVYAVCLVIMFHLFVMFYEEPTLRKNFGEDYIQYCQRVNRWLPIFPNRGKTK